MGGSSPALNSWADAVLAARLFALMHRHGMRPHAVVSAGAGPVRDRFCTLLTRLCSARVSRLPMGAGVEALVGGLDLSATLATGKSVVSGGALAVAGDGVLMVPCAQMLEEATLPVLAQSMEDGFVAVERDGVSRRDRARASIVLLDESEADEPGVAASLVDRSDFHLDLSALSIGEAVDGEQAMGGSNPALITVEDKALEAACTMALGFGLTSLRPAMQVLRVARAHAGLDGRECVGDDDLTVAMRLSLFNRALVMPSRSEEEEEQDEQQASEPPPPPQQEDGENDRALSETEMPPAEMIIDALAANLPDDLLAQLAAKAHRRAGQKGRAGSKRRSARRGRPLASRAGRLERGKRLDLVATLRRAVPWQRMRAAQVEAQERSKSRFHIRAEDFMIRRCQEKGASCVIFVVDASGSTALNRLAETKGAIELLLGQSYARRDHVAMIAFRGEEAQVILPPTRALVRAKRALAGLPGGGGTPLAGGLNLARQLAADEERKGRTPSIILMTDGSANIALSGDAGRGPAQEDAMAVAAGIGREGSDRHLLLDIGRFGNRRARELADAMGAAYLPMPFASADGLSDAVRQQTATG
ncbi:MAG: magnesium chelatase subunit D [Pseudomonadota bacterium]